MDKMQAWTLNNDEILFEMAAPALPTHTNTSLQLWS